MPSFNDIDELIVRFLSQRATPAETQALLKWMGEADENREQFNKIKSVWSSKAKFVSNDESRIHQLRDRIWEDAQKKTPTLKTKNPKAIDFLFWAKLAASLLLILVAAWFFFAKREIAPQQNAKTIAIVEKVNPAGQKSNFKLPDGTHVWLNAESQLTFPEEFKDSIRLVKLEGEAFFEVTKNAKKPFIVEAGGTQTRALGTAFNISAYPESNSISIALLEGKVKIDEFQHQQTAVLNPGEELSVGKKDAAFTKNEFNYVKMLGWKDGYLYLEKANLKQTITTLERWYGVKIETAESFQPNKEWRFSGKFQNKSLEYVLKVFSYPKMFDFEITDTNVILK